MRISDWSSDVCSSDLARADSCFQVSAGGGARLDLRTIGRDQRFAMIPKACPNQPAAFIDVPPNTHPIDNRAGKCFADPAGCPDLRRNIRSEEQTSELQSPMRTSYAVFGLTKKIQKPTLSTKTSIFNTHK